MGYVNMWCVYGHPGKHQFVARQLCLYLVKTTAAKYVQSLNIYIDRFVVKANLLFEHFGLVKYSNPYTYINILCLMNIAILHTLHGQSDPCILVTFQSKIIAESGKIPALFVCPRNCKVLRLYIEDLALLSSYLGDSSAHRCLSEAVACDCDEYHPFEKY